MCGLGLMTSENGLVLDSYVHGNGSPSSIKAINCLAQTAAVITETIW
jgi:hypothetical protein